jgi:hypothetical protein
VKSFAISGLVVWMCVAALGVSAKDESTNPAPDATQSKIRVGVINLDVTGADAATAAKANETVAQTLGDIGFYKVYPQADLETAFASIKQKFPSHCRDPRCVAAIGSALGLDRMVYGELDKNGSRIGISLVLLDVQSTQVSQHVSMEAEAGATLAGVVRAATYKLHGLSAGKDSVKAGPYFGPQVHNEIQPVISTVAVLAAGLVWAAANGTLSNFSHQANFDTSSASHRNSSSLSIPLFARPSAMGECYVAASDDATGVFYNPAGMAWVPNMDIAVAYQYRFEQLNLFAASFANKATRDFGFGHALYYISDYDHLQNEMYFLSSYAYKFNRLLPFLRPISLGVTLKIININTPARADGDVSQNSLGAGLDVGMQAELADHIRLGVVCKDLPTYVKVNNGSDQYLESQPPVLLVGGTYQAGYSTFLICEGQIPLYSDQPWKFAGGIEQEVWQVLLIRAGAKKDPAFDQPWILTAGFGLKIPLEWMGGKYFAADAAYEYNLGPSLPVANFSLRMGF